MLDQKQTTAGVVRRLKLSGVTIFKTTEKYEEADVVRRLERLGVTIFKSTKTINTLGVHGAGRWGMIDYLTRYCGYNT